ncbi:MAG: porin [Candidatus Kapabacteria bacterium]|nr:porin [Candidatus Kapabacteria bacterium]
MNGSLLRFMAIIGYIIALAAVDSRAQASNQSQGSFDFNSEGVVFQTADSSSRVVMRFRMQNWLTVTSATMAEGDDLNLSTGSTDFVVRRLRLRFGGSLVDPRLTFNIQLSFTRADMDWNDTQFPNIIRDAMIYWNFNKNLQVSFGQGKLPGNRQRVISSADLEMPDRSITNSAFTLDRDFGVQGFWRPIHGDMVVNVRGAISSGDGRNQPVITGGGLAYTGRVEFLPFGAFTNGGDYFEGDLAREQKPKVSVGVSYQHNENQTRTRGELGKNLYAQRTSNVLYADGLLKYDGFSLYGEYAQRTAVDPITYKDTTKKDYAAVFIGTGYMLQASYIFPSMWNVVARYAVTEAGSQLAGLSEYQKQVNIAAVIGYYINKHRIKINLEMGTNRSTLYNSNDLVHYNYYSRLNMELGI